MPEVSTKKPKVDRSAIRMVMSVFWMSIRKYPLVAAIALISIVSIHVASVIIPIYFKSLLDTATLSTLPRTETAQKLVLILEMIAWIWIFRWCAYRTFGGANIFFEANVMKNLAIRAFENLLGHSYRFFSNSFTGSLVRKANRLSKSFETIIDQIWGSLLPLVIISTGILVVLFREQPRMGWLLSGWIVLFVGIYFSIALWKVKYDRQRAEKDSESTGVISDALTNVITIKLFSNYDHEKGLYQNVVDELRKLRIFTWGIGEAVDALQGACMIAIEFVIFYVWIRLWQSGSASIGDFILIQGLILVLFDRIWDFGRVIRRIYEALAEAFEMVEILNLPHEIKDIPNAPALRTSEGKIEFKDVAFGFHDERNVLEDFNLSISPREKIALVGPSGAGKTTVVTLLLRFHDVDHGEILIDGQNIAHITQASLRKHVALVPQDPILFHRTLMENIRYGKLDATDEEVLEAAKKAHCHEFISRLPHGYNTYVGERGVKLSGGERQRVAIARAILADTPILILDEATSSLDSEVESLIQDALKNLMGYKTAIVIAHRLSTIVQMDRIIVIDEGKISETGTHETLIAHGGIYQRLWSLQAERFIE